jgi:hypothetical protein
MAKGSEIVRRKPPRTAERIWTFLVFGHDDTCSRPLNRVMSQAIHGEQGPLVSNRRFLRRLPAG